METAFQRPRIVSRDQQTLELRQYYPMPPPGTDSYSYALEAYFFFPRSFGVTPHTWNRDMFYRNTTIHTRLHAPGLTLEMLKDTRHPRNPAQALLGRIGSLVEDDTIDGAAMTALAQIFGAELTDAIRMETKSVLAEVRGAPSPKLWEAVDTLARHCLDAMAALRQVRTAAQAFLAIVPPTLLPSLMFAEEYTAAIIDESLSELALAIGKSRALHDGSCNAVAMRARIATALEELNHRRTTQGFVVPRSYDAEYYSYRLGLLKKELQRSLYVNTRALSTDSFYANSAAMVAAGLAATWATLAQIPSLTGPLRESQEGFLIASSLGIGAYVLKDRIKDWVKTRLARRWARWDHDIQVQGDSLAEVGLGAFEGSAREHFTWETEATIPAEISAIRRHRRTVRGATNELEQVCRYRRWLKLSQGETSPLPPGYVIDEMLRLNLDDVLRRLDDPSHTVPYYDGAGRFDSAAMPKVYHLNVVTVAHDERNGVRYAHRTRVVLNKQRILRIEPIVA